MLFPESERIIYKDNPLVEVICQIRFPTILRIGEGQVADFQDKIRENYPIYKLQEPSIELPQLPRESPIFDLISIAITSKPSTHRFSTKDIQRFISLSSDFLALTETKYEKWESFREKLVEVETSLREVYKPAFYSRIGLRYRDIISLERLGLKNVEWHELFKPYIVAELADKEILNSITRIQTRTIIKIPEIPNGQIILIHGLIRPAGSNEECYLIDADFSIERKEGLNEPFETLDKFNRMAGRLFRWAITEKLHNAMGPRII